MAKSNPKVGSVKQIFLKLILLLSLVSATFSLFVTIAAEIDKQRQAYAKQLNQYSKIISLNLVEHIFYGNEDNVHKILYTFASSDIENIHVYKKNKNDISLFASYNKIGVGEVAPQMTQLTNPSRLNQVNFSDDHLEQFSVINLNNTTTGYLYLRSSTEPMQQTIYQHGYFNFGFALLMILIINIWAFLIHHRLVDPIDTLIDNIRQITNDKGYSGMVKHTNIEELDVLTRAFNKMLKRMQRHINKQATAEKEVRQLNQNLQQKVYDRAQLDKLKDEFLANTSHELRTPLNGIIGLAESLIDGIGGPQSQISQNNLAMIVNSGKRLSNLINDVLDFSKLKNHSLLLNTKPVDLHSMVEVVLTLLYPLLTHDKVQLINNIDKGLKPAQADEDRLHQILQNLIGNAIKFTDEGRVIIDAYEQDDRIMVSITDTGVGIKKAQLKSIFNSFEQLDGQTQRQYSGTGLGLTITQQLIHLHGGKIAVQSKPGVGSTFKFDLCIAKQQAAISESIEKLNEVKHYEVHKPQLDKEPIDSAKFNILVVDDEPINRQVLMNHLSLHQYRLVEAGDGDQAIQLMESGDPFDLVLLDIMMPRTSGYQVCKHIRQHHSINDLPIIFLTAKNQPSDLVHSFELGANDHLNKPVSKHELLTRVETHLKLLDINRDLERKVDERTSALEQKNYEIEQKNQEIIQTQQQLIQSEKMVSLGELTAGVAHEINNPNNFVHVSSQNLSIDLDKLQQFIVELAGDDTDTEIIAALKLRFSPLYKHLETIKDGSERIKMIVRDLRSFTQLDAAEYKTVVVTDCLQSTINLVKTKNHAVAHFVTEFEVCPELLCYPAQLNQVFMNLIVNACDAIRDKLNHHQLDSPGQVIIGCYLAGNNVEIKIKDNGCGMNEQTLNKLFQPFYTTKPIGEGTGLGLSISYGIIQKHQGKIEVESKLGEGSTFTLTIPRHLQI